jgi:dipeptidase
MPALSRTIHTAGDLFILTWREIEQKYAWKRPISQPQTAFSFVTQASNWLPDNIGGICWYSVDDNHTNVFMPLYLGMTRMPQSLTIADAAKFDFNSAFWIFSLLANYSYDIYSLVIEDIQKAQNELESRSITMVSAVDKAASYLYNTNPEMAIEYLTDFSVTNAEYIVSRWNELANGIYSRYNDRYIRTEDILRPQVKGVGYPEEFMRRAVRERPGYFDVKWRDPAEYRQANTANE